MFAFPTKTPALEKVLLFEHMKLLLLYTFWLRN